MQRKSGGSKRALQPKAPDGSLNEGLVVHAWDRAQSLVERVVENIPARQEERRSSGELIREVGGNNCPLPHVVHRRVLIVLRGPRSAQLGVQPFVAEGNASGRS